MHRLLALEIMKIIHERETQKTTKKKQTKTEKSKGKQTL